MLVVSERVAPALIRDLQDERQSTRGLQGGFNGPALKKGDEVRAFAAPTAIDLVGRSVPTSAVPDLSKATEIRVVLGPQDHLLTRKSLDDFLTSEWDLSPSSDRMGFRLLGPEMAFLPRADYLVRDAGALPSNVVINITPLGGTQVTTGNEAIRGNVLVQLRSRVTTLYRSAPAHIHRLNPETRECRDRRCSRLNTRALLHRRIHRRTGSHWPGSDDGPLIAPAAVARTLRLRAADTDL